MTTVVVIVLAMSMLILGLVLIRSIFTGATENVVSINEKVKAQIDKLFTEEDQETALFLSNSIAQIKQGQTWGISFALKNIGSSDKRTGYNIAAETPSQSICPGITKTIAESWIIAGKTGGTTAGSEIIIGSGKSYYGLIRFQVPRDAPLNCVVRYTIGTTATGINGFPSIPFDIQVK
jgi:hypothetical protein